MKVPDPPYNLRYRRAAKTYAKLNYRFSLYASQRTLKAMLDSTMTRWQARSDCADSPGDCQQCERIQQLTVPTLVVLGHRDTVFLL